VPADPTAAIKAQVKEILNQPKPVAAPINADPAKAGETKTGAATFPPQGD
jgi:hypothetical protein